MYLKVDVNVKNINESNLRKAFLESDHHQDSSFHLSCSSLNLFVLCSESVSVLLSSISDAVKRPFPSSLPVLIARREKSEKKLCCSEQK